jgi:DHA1 family bicyclomycin/chloramphenicol resistance-like MFS transporter
MYLPSFPMLTREFGATPGQVQWTLSTFFLGFALGQLIYGPLSDRYGRKPLLMVGLSIYVLTSLLCMVSPRIEVLAGLRFLQALGRRRWRRPCSTSHRVLAPRPRCLVALSSG